MSTIKAALEWHSNWIELMHTSRRIMCDLCESSVEKGWAVRRITGFYKGRAKYKYCCLDCGGKLAEHYRDEGQTILDKIQRIQDA